jgi:alpha-galactosidase
MKNKVKIAYIGGGSRLWARSLMSDLALEKELSGEVVLYDIDLESAQNNVVIGNKMMKHKDAVGQWVFSAAKSLKEAITGADFVLISILPGTFNEMKHYVHDTEKWGVYQTVGDTVGPAGVFRSLIMMPMYEEIALAIKAYAPDAWVINFTNPMTMCVQTLYDVFPEIKAFGNCHEVFFVQRILARALKEEMGIDVAYHEIQINPIGINHFTWINYASYKDIDLMPIYRNFVLKYHKDGLANGENGWKKVGPFGSAERVKLDLYKNFEDIAAAGDRHLVEFLPHGWYMKDQETIDAFKFHLTPVQKRIDILNKGNASALRIIKDEEAVSIHPSGEEGVAQIKALLGYQELVTNVNMPNKGQISNLPLGHVVETNALFRADSVRPVFSGDMPLFATSVTRKHIKNHQLLLEAFRKKDLSYGRLALHGDLSLEHLLPEQIDEMFDEVIKNIQHYLKYYEKGCHHA